MCWIRHAVCDWLHLFIFATGNGRPGRDMPADDYHFGMARKLSLTGEKNFKF